MKITIITVCFNSAVTLEKTIQSVADQKYKNVEYIIVDGNSTDDTVAIIKKNEAKITRWISEPDSGLYEAMNKGISMATGDIIGILNSDDTFHSEHVLRDIARVHEINKIDASVGNIVQHNEEGKILRQYSASKWTPEKLKIGYMPPHPAIFFKRELFQKFGAYELDFKIGADFELITRFFLKHHITWKYSGIITTSMLIGGLSSSGLSSYKLISKEIGKALKRNHIKHSRLKVKARGLWKVIGLLKRRSKP